VQPAPVCTYLTVHPKKKEKKFRWRTGENHLLVHEKKDRDCHLPVELGGYPAVVRLEPGGGGGKFALYSVLEGVERKQQLMRKVKGTGWSRSKGRHLQQPRYQEERKRRLYDGQKRSGWVTLSYQKGGKKNSRQTPVAVTRLFLWLEKSVISASATGWKRGGGRLGKRGGSTKNFVKSHKHLGSTTPTAATLPKGDCCGH